jgi:hypothetical protein
MTVLKFQGKVTTGNACRVGYEDERDGWIHIGDRDLLADVEEVKWSGPVTVAIGDDRFTGDLVAEEGWGYSEYTPVDSDELKVGRHNILEILDRREGEEVTVWIADEPVNLLEDDRSGG